MSSDDLTPPHEMRSSTRTVVAICLGGLLVLIVIAALSVISLNSINQVHDSQKSQARQQKSTAQLLHRVDETLSTIRRSSVRSECRNRVNNQSIANFQIDIRDLLVANAAHSTDRELAVLHRMSGRPDPNAEILKTCPPPIVTPSK